MPIDAFRLGHRYVGLPGLSGRATADGVRALALHPAVARVGLDHRIRGALAESAQIIGAPVAHAHGFTGDGVTVAVLDSGIDTDHPDLAGDVAPGAYHIPRRRHDDRSRRGRRCRPRHRGRECDHVRGRAGARGRRAGRPRVADQGPRPIRQWLRVGLRGRDRSRDRESCDVAGARGDQPEPRDVQQLHVVPVRQRGCGDPAARGRGATSGRGRHSGVRRPPATAPGPRRCRRRRA